MPSQTAQIIRPVERHHLAPVDHVATLLKLQIGGSRVRWIWTEQKNRANKRDHHLSFETAKLVFDDPLAVSRPDLHPDGDRWQTIGLVGNIALFVVHTWPEAIGELDEPIGRLISARKATAHERRAYEEGEF